MMVGKEDLGLSLSLGLGPLHHDHHFLSIVPKSTTCTPLEYWSDRPIDVNRATTTERESSELQEDLQAGASSSSPNTSIVSNSAGSGGKRDRASAMMLTMTTMDHENETERACSRGTSDEEDANDGSRKKLRLSKDQSVLLEENFKEHNTLNQKQKLALAKQLKLRARQVEVWFQNRRARTKLKQTEVDCELLKRCCESLTEENRRLQKEGQELRALKMYMHMTPPTTLIMCPSCERILSSTTSTSASSAQPSHHQLRPMPLPVGLTGMPWAPIPLRPNSFPHRC